MLCKTEINKQTFAGEGKKADVFKASREKEAARAANAYKPLSQTKYPPMKNSVLKTKPFCDNCGTKNVSKGKFCQECGNNLAIV